MLLTAADADEPTIETIDRLAPLRGTGLNADICGLLFVYNHDGKFHSPDPISEANCLSFAVRLGNDRMTFAIGSAEFSLGTVLSLGKANPQPNPQNAMSCSTSANFGSPRGLVSH
jgi:hypothetical protein